MIQELFKRVKQKQQQRAGDAFAQYWEGIVARLAGDEQLDAESVVAAAEAIGRDAQQVEADVALFRHRQRLSEELAAVPKWQAESAKLQATIDQAAAELRDHQTRLQAIIDATYAQRAEIENRIAGAAQHATELSNGCPNPELRIREQELQAQRRELQERRRPLAESLGNGPSTLGGALSHARQQLEQFEERASLGDADAREYCQRLKSNIAGYQQRIKQAQSQLNDLDEQLQKIDAELVAVRQQKLNP